jgi:hypothetical protein
VRRGSRSRAALDVAATAASRWILAATSRPSKPEFHHSSPIFRLGIPVAAAVGTSSCRASLNVGNASMDDTDAAATFFATDDKSFVPILSIVPFVIRANVECLAYSSIYVFKCPSSTGHEFVDGVLNIRGFDEGESGGTSNDASS